MERGWAAGKGFSMGILRNGVLFMAAVDRIAGCALVHLGLCGVYLLADMYTKAFTTELSVHATSFFVCLLGLACCPEVEA